MRRARRARRERNAGAKPSTCLHVRDGAAAVSKWVEVERLCPPPTPHTQSHLNTASLPPSVRHRLVADAFHLGRTGCCSHALLPLLSFCMTPPLHCECEHLHGFMHGCMSEFGLSGVVHVQRRGLSERREKGSGVRLSDMAGGEKKKNPN